MSSICCPHCGQECLSFWSKINLSPNKGKPCGSCGRVVSVGKLSSTVVFLFASFLPLVALVASLLINDSMAFAIIAVLFGSLASVWAHYRFVPLVASAA